MLVLTRKPEEGIRIGKDVVVKILSISRNRVKIGIEAPKEFYVLRTELDSGGLGEDRQPIVKRA